MCQIKFQLVLKKDNVFLDKKSTWSLLILSGTFVCLVVRPSRMHYYCVFLHYFLANLRDGVGVCPCEPLIHSKGNKPCPWTVARKKASRTMHGPSARCPTWQRDVPDIPSHQRPGSTTLAAIPGRVPSMYTTTDLNSVSALSPGSHSPETPTSGGENALRSSSLPPRRWAHTLPPSLPPPFISSRLSRGAASRTQPRRVLHPTRRRRRRRRRRAACLRARLRCRDEGRVPGIADRSRATVASSVPPAGR
jgi:hypothetical protein